MEIEGTDERVSVVANAIGFAMFSTDGRKVIVRDGVQAVEVSDEEAERCRAAARRVLAHLAEYDG